MGSEQGNTKVTAAHRQRHAYLYIRQSTLRQVFVNTDALIGIRGLLKRVAQ